MVTKRIEEIINGMESFKNDTYQKKELCDEMFALQKDLVKQTYGVDCENLNELRIWDVEKYYEQLNEQCGNIAQDELNRFKEGSKKICNLIKAEISGKRGEYKAFKALEFLGTKNRVLKNVELNDGNSRTELDAVVITTKCVTIVEVKNTSKDIFIDENGNYYRTGDFLKLDSNIAEKMMCKEDLLRKVLDKAGFWYVPIRSVVVFTNNRIEVQNRYHQLRTCFVSQLGYIIDGYRMIEMVMPDDIEKIGDAVNAAECKEAYPFEFDVNQYKLDYATLKATLEQAQDMEAAVVNMPVMKSSKKSFIDLIRSFFASKQFRFVGSFTTFITVIMAILISTVIG